MFDIATISLLCVFFIIFFTRILILRKQNIKVFVFGKTHKSDFILMPLMLAYIYIIVSSATNLPMPAVLKTPLFQSTAAVYIGLLLSLSGLVLFAWALQSFKSSFRVGIDTQKPDKLITSGAFAVSRNPIYVAFSLFFLGILLIHPNIAIAIAYFCVFIPAIYRQILREEKFMKSYYGQEYLDYAKKVRRYL